MTPPEHRRDLVEIEGLLREQDRVGASGDPREERDPPGAPTHHLDQHEPVVALRGRVETVDRVGRDLNRRGEPDAGVGAGQIVVVVLGIPTTGTPPRTSARPLLSSPHRRS
jgi:hypothetical protein